MHSKTALFVRAELFCIIQHFCDNCRPIVLLLLLRLREMVLETITAFSSFSEKQFCTRSIIFFTLSTVLNVENAEEL